ncbi:hypothetical protein TRICI_000641 [Trichomonascus ciferrii]|uniref:Uncharacterized protein n=1 Tax=Trichomonascus ciferrii TaxID=44093 RepID=A0A642VAP9_9ASCO|nr:hypothetical protein TRICI_000641 [Trichomonascus ciferrii]
MGGNPQKRLQLEITDEFVEIDNTKGFGVEVFEVEPVFAKAFTERVDFDGPVMIERIFYGDKEAGFRVVKSWLAISRCQCNRARLVVADEMIDVIAENFIHAILLLAGKLAILNSVSFEYMCFVSEGSRIFELGIVGCGG